MTFSFVFDEKTKKISFFVCIGQKIITFAPELETKAKNKDSNEIIYLCILLLFLLLL